MIITNHLTASQAAHVAALEAVCKKHNSLQGNIFLSDDLNFDRDFPCFYLLYHPDHAEDLISFLSVFAPSQTEAAEIYAYTDPAWRRQGCFNTLLEAALQNIYEYGIDEVCFVHEPGLADTEAVLAGLGTVYRYSECLMQYKSTASLCSPLRCQLSEASAELLLLPADYADLPAITHLHAESFCSDIDASHDLICEVFADSSCQIRKLASKTQNSSQQLFGICFYTPMQTEISVFGVAIAPGHQHKGYGIYMLTLLLQELAEAYPDTPVVLQVNSQNHAAFALYQKLGFRIRVQFDYDYASCEELLELF